MILRFRVRRAFWHPPPTPDSHPFPGAAGQINRGSIKIVLHQVKRGGLRVPTSFLLKRRGHRGHYPDGRMALPENVKPKNKSMGHCVKKTSHEPIERLEYFSLDHQFPAHRRSSKNIPQVSNPLFNNVPLRLKITPDKAAETYAVFICTPGRAQGWEAAEGQMWIPTSTWNAIRRGKCVFDPGSLVIQIHL